MNGKKFAKKAVVCAVSAFSAACLLSFSNAGAYSTSHKDSADHVQGSGFNRVETHYHVGSWKPYDDAYVRSVVGYPGMNYYTAYGKICSRSEEDHYNYRKYYAYLNSIQTCNANLPGHDTGTGYCVSILLSRIRIKTFRKSNTTCALMLNNTSFSF